MNPSEEHRNPPADLRTCFIWAVSILLLATVLRAFHLGALEMWLDECHSILTAQSPRGVFAELRNDTNAPLYFILLKAWTAPFGISEIGARSLSALLGVLSLAALALWLTELGAPRSASLWAMAVGAVTPLHIYYSQEARGYTLIWLLVTLAAWSITRACRTGSRLLWFLHAVAVTLSLYAHDLTLAFLPGYWLIGWYCATGKRRMVPLAFSHTAAILLYLPWFAHLLAQPKGVAFAWIEPLWRAIPPPLAIPRSLEALTIGGLLPNYLRAQPSDMVLRASAILFATIAFGCALVASSGHKSADQPADDPGALPPAIWPSPVQQLYILLAFVLLPLLAPFAYSLLFHPIYVVARYDTLAFPGFLAVMGLGFSGAQEILSQRTGRAAPYLLGLPLLGLGALAYAPKLQTFDDPIVFRPQSSRGTILKTAALPDDLVVCMAQEGAKIAYQMLRLDIDAPLLTYPLSTRRHMGWFVPQAVLAEGTGPLQHDAQAILSMLDGVAPKAKRIWVFMDPYSNRTPPPGQKNDYAAISSVFMEAIRARGLKPVALPPDLQAQAERLGVELYGKQ
ncbi:MAG: glycosyltransferase family 39 protein [Candidatus Sumerlaeaceae bacterium]|nr:glycosyltransferase family 39 protein [Candidatus Sumerlaeaceae bacterium]